MMIEELKHNLAELIQKYQEANKDQAEADVRANYIDWLLFYLGWDVWGKDPAHTTRYQREGYIRGAGKGSVCDAVEDGHGGFLTRLDVEQFTETVRRLLLNPELRQEQSCKAREHANKFSLDDMTESLLRVYGTLSEGKRTT